MIIYLSQGTQTTQNAQMNADFIHLPFTKYKIVNC